MGQAKFLVKNNDEIKLKGSAAGWLYMSDIAFLQGFKLRNDNWMLTSWVTICGNSPESFNIISYNPGID